jgi:acyl carrier protein
MTVRRRPPSLPDPLPKAPLPIWQIEEAVLDVVAEQQGLPRGKLTPQLRLVEDLNIDSLDVLDLLFWIENTFEISTDKELTKRVFAQSPFTLHHFAELVFYCWGTGASRRKFFKSAPLQERPGALPSTQLGGVPSLAELAAGPLFVPLGTLGPVPFYQRKTDGMRCARIPADTATLGSDDPAALADERSRHRAILSAYLIDAEPVSTTAYARFLNAVGDLPESIYIDWCDVTDHRRHCFQLERINGFWRPIAGTEQHPMVLVSWYGANAYSLWANRCDWRHYRGAIPEALREFPAQFRQPPAAGASFLPSEAQWEHAAEPNPAAAGVSPPWAARHVRGATYSAATMSMLPVSAPAGVSRFGLCHMPGNVWQWCRDYYAPDFYASPAARRQDPQNDAPTPVRSERGGSWVGPACLATPTYRRGRVPAARGRCLGFRCVSLVPDLV